MFALPFPVRHCARLCRRVGSVSLQRRDVSAWGACPSGSATLPGTGTGAGAAKG